VPVRVQALVRRKPVGGPVAPVVEVVECAPPEVVRLVELEGEPVAEHDLVGPLEPPEVVQLVPRRVALEHALEPREAAAELAHRDALPVAGQLLERGVIADVIIGPLVEMDATPLDARDRVRVATYDAP
jgi:hypothetical protein